MISELDKKHLQSYLEEISVTYYIGDYWFYVFVDNNTEKSFVLKHVQSPSSISYVWPSVFGETVSYCFKIRGSVVESLENRITSVMDSSTFKHSCGGYVKPNSVTNEFTCDTCGPLQTGMDSIRVEFRNTVGLYETEYNLVRKFNTFCVENISEELTPLSKPRPER